MAHDSIINTATLENAGFTLARDPRKAIEEMMATIDALRAVYIEETTALDNVDTRRFMDLQERKIETARNYQHGIAQILARKDEIRAVDPTLRERLVARQEEFAALSAKNMQSLERVNRSVKKLGERMMKSAREAAQKDVVNYGKRGQLNQYKGPVSIGVSEQA